MDRNRTSIGLLSIAGLIALVAVARGLDSLAASARRHLPLAHPPYDAILWTPALSALLLAAVLVLLYRFVLARLSRNVWVAALYLFVGVFLAFARVLYFVPAVSDWVPSTFYAPVISPISYTMLAGSFLAVIGLFMLILPRQSG